MEAYAPKMSNEVYEEITQECGAPHSSHRRNHISPLYHNWQVLL